MISELTGIVLAGGRSSRFGSNKAIVSWDGRPLVRAVADRLLTVMPKVVVVSKKDPLLSPAESTGLSIVPDLFEEHHALGGIYSGLLRMKTTHAFVCACDMPKISEKLIHCLWDARGDFDAVIPVWRDQRQPLCGIYSRECAGLIRSFIDEGRLGIIPLFDELRTRFCLENEIREVDSEGVSFLDIDTREDFERVRGLRS